MLVGFRESCELLRLRGVLNFFLCFWSELATDEVVLHGTFRLDSKIRSLDSKIRSHSFWREQTLVATKLFLSLTRIDFTVAVSSRAVRISSRAVRVYQFDAYSPHTGPFLFCSSKEIARGAARDI